MNTCHTVNVDYHPKKPKMLSLVHVFAPQTDFWTHMPALILHRPDSMLLQLLNRRHLLRRLSITSFIGLLCLVCAQSEGSPWIEPGSERTRHHIQSLADAGVISTPTTVWPLMWSNLKADLDAIEPHDLSKAQLWSYHYLKHELRKAMNARHVEQAAHLSSQAEAISNFASDTRERYQSSIAFGYTGANVAYRLKATYAHEPADDHTYRLDGSYLSYLAGNWAIGIGEIDRWWGPGWESSLILSHNARPTPSLYLQRNLAEPFETPLLSWLGPWQMVTFLSQLESARAVPDTWLWGMRVNLKPLRQLDIGLSRTAQWGGKGRPSDIDTFIKLVAGRDNLDDYGANDSHERTQEPGNQLAGVDWRWGYQAGGLSGAIYGQFIGEDEAGGMPSRSIGMAGIEASSVFGDTHTRLSLEAQNTTVYFYDTEKRRGNVAYEHSIYQSGYRYYNRPLGSSTDNDTESVTLRGQWYFRSGHNLNLSFGRHRLNIDNSNKSGAGGSIFGYEEQNTYKTQVNYTAPLSKVFLMQLGVFHYSDSITHAGIELDTGGFVSIRAHW